MNHARIHCALPRAHTPQSISRKAAGGNSVQTTFAMLYSVSPRSWEPTLQFQTFDADYIESLCAGDHRTQDHFVGYFTSLIHLKLRSRLNSPQAIEDVRQETFARVFAVLRKNGLKEPGSLGVFVNNVCNHVLFEHYRSRKDNDSLDEEGQPEPVSKDADALDIFSARQIKEKVRRILLLLPIRDRQLLNAVFLEERDRDELCREFGVDRDYLRVLLHRAKQEFKTEYLKFMESKAAI